MDRRNATPGSRALAKLIDEHGEALIPDLRLYYGIDLRDLFSEDQPISPRWALMHANALPLESDTVAEQRGGQHFRGWDEGRYMLAQLIDATRLNTYAFALAHRDPDLREPDPPSMYPLPDNVRARNKRPPKPGSFASIVGSKLAAVKERKRKERAENAGRTGR